MRYTLMLTFIFFWLHPLQAESWENLIEMMDEAATTDIEDYKLLGNKCRSKEDAMKRLLNVKPLKTPSKAYEFYKEDALEFISKHVNFYGEGIDCVPNWQSIAGITLGTDNLYKCIAGLVALGDIRGLQSFRMTLDKLIGNLSFEELSRSSDIEGLTKRFEDLRLR